MGAGSIEMMWVPTNLVAGDVVAGRESQDLKLVAVPTSYPTCQVIRYQVRCTRHDGVYLTVWHQPACWCTGSNDTHP